MSTRSSARNIFLPLDNPELTIRRRAHVDPTLLDDFEMAAKGNGDLPVLDLQTIEESCQPSLNGQGGPIAPIAIQATNFGRKNDMIQQVQNSCQFLGLPGDDAISILTNYCMSPKASKNSINTFELMAKMFLEKYFLPSMVTKLKNEITNYRQRPDESLFEAWERYKLSIDRCPNHNMLPVTKIDTLYNGLTLRHCDIINAAAGGIFMKMRPEECDDLIENMTGHHNHWDTSAQRSKSSSSITSSFDTGIAALKAEMAKINKNLMRVLQVNQQVKVVNPNCKTCGGPHSFNDCPATVGQTQNVHAAGAYQGSRTLPGNTITNLKEELKGITTHTGTAYQGPTIPPTSSSLLSVVEHKTKATKDTVPPTNNRSTKDVQPPVVQTESLILISEPVVAPIIEPIVALVSAPKPNQRPSIPYPSRLHDQKLRDKDNDQRDKIFQISKDLNFNISFADALILMTKFCPTNKDKLSELARTPLNEHCSAVLLKKLLEKLGTPSSFSSLWNKLSLPDLSPTCMTLELVDRSISCPVGVVKDVLVKVGTFHFSADFTVVHFDADPLVPLILRRSFLKTGRALIDVFEGELTLRLGKEAITFNLDQTSRYSANYNDITANRIDVIDMACEEYSQEVLDFFDVIASGNPTPYYDLIVSTTSLTLTPFRESDFLLDEDDAFLAPEDDPTLPEVDHSYVDTEGDILILEDLPPHLVYAFLEGDDKLLVIIVKYLSVEEKIALIMVLKSHKRAIAWKLSDIKGNDPEFCTHKILMEEDFKPTVQHQRRVNPKIHDVIKNEVLKLLDDGLIYPISDSPWIKKKPHSLILTKRLPTATCLLGYAMHRARFREKMLKRYEDTNLFLNWEKSHFMVKEGIVLGHKISKNGIEVDKSKVNVIAHPTTVKGIRSFLGHAGFYQRFIKDISKIARPMTRLLKNDTLFFFSKECVEAFQTLKRNLTEAPILIAPD
nr:reverse transcriptase domain-containing protein [Tanacetum cinerariifolium]